MLNVRTIEDILSDSKKFLTSARKYKKIMDTLYWTDVSEDKDFQKTFNGFFIMSFRKKEYYDMFYSFLEQKKDKGVSFEETLEHLKKAEGKVEISFSSKLIHVINPKRPIWDNNVAVQHFGMELPNYNIDIPARQNEAVRAYHEYCSRFYEYLDSSDGQAMLRMFNDKYPHTGFTDTKKLDFILWSDV